MSKKPNRFGKKPVMFYVDPDVFETCRKYFAWCKKKNIKRNWHTELVPAVDELAMEATRRMRKK